MSSSRQQSHTTLSKPGAVWLLALVLTLRALVPIGYMPDLDALRNGQLAITICSASQPAPQGITAQYVAGNFDFPDFTPSSADCPFGMLFHQAWLPHVATLQMLPAPMLILPQWRLAHNTQPVQRALGPPLGARAPPA